MKKLVRSIAAAAALSGLGFEVMNSHLLDNKTEHVNAYGSDQPEQKNNPSTTERLAKIATESSDMSKKEKTKSSELAKSNTEAQAKLLNKAALSIFGRVEQRGYRIVKYIPADEADKPDSRAFPVIIVSNKENNKEEGEECGGAFFISQDSNNPRSLVTGMTYSGKLENITDQSKVNGKEMFNGEIQHPEGSLIEEAPLDKSAELIDKLTSLACWSYHEERKNKTR